MKHKNRGKKGKNIPGNYHETPGGQQFYAGPLRLPGAKDQENLRTTELSFAFQISSGVGSTITNSIALQLNNFDEYTSFANLYDEYRLLAADMIFVPNAEKSIQAATLYAPLIMVLDRDASAVLTSYGNGIDYESAVVASLNAQRKISYRMSGSEDALFITNPATVPAWFKLYAQGLSASTAYGWVFVKGLWQGRARF